ncbi:MAG: biotin/lipoyl-binding protein, partial [Actinobacteria bacterium]|nr:biotin/lipoyl-binding protein [Actinomycetota bacterium]
MKQWVARILRLLIVVAVVAVLVLGARALIVRKKAQLAKAPRYDVGPMPVYVVAAKQGTLLEKRDYLAVVEPIRIANISARLTATVEEVLCDEGDVVHSGEVLIRLDGREIGDDIASVQAQIEQARADLASNESTVASLVKSVAYWDREAKRDASLAEKGDIAGAQAEATADKANTFQGNLDAAKSKSTAIKHLIESLNQKKAQLQTRLGYCTICSPYDGLLTSRLVDPGDLASPGKTLIVAEDRSQLKLAFDVPQQDLPRVRE